MSYIVPIDIPKNCFECPCCTLGYCRVAVKTNEYAKYVFSDGQDGRYSDCPLIELPPHGRLIDIKSVEDGKFVTVSNDYQRWWNGALESVIDNAPTVIEAEGETDA